MKKRILALLLSGAMLLGCIPGTALAAEKEESSSDKTVATSAAVTYPYQDTSLTFEERATDLVSRMTLDEKALQTITSSAAAIPRLGVKQYNYWSEGLHGVARSGAATSFPHGLGIAATWNPEMVLEMGTAISNEARGFSNDKGKGLSYWSPTINLGRDPRWGRAEEGYGEDTYLTSVLGESYVNGMQGDDEKYLKTIATLKHFLANNSEYNRHTGSSDIDDRDLREYYSYAFKNVVENTDVASVMSSYNQVNGIPMSANKFILTDILRNTWGFDGYVTSDCGAIKDVWANHKWKPEGMDRAVNSVEATGLSIKAGTDINCGGEYHVNVKKSIEQGILTEDELDRALIRLFTARMKTGEFDPDDQVAYKSAKYSYANQVESEEHKQLAEDMTDEAIILLKNDNILPLNKSKKKIVVVGELAQRCIQGDYSAAPSEKNKSSAIQGIRAAAARAGSDIEVEYINHNGTKDVASYLLNVKGFELDYGNSKKSLQASEADTYKALRVENTAAKNFGYINSGAYAVYKNVDLAGLKKFSVEAAGAAKDAYSSVVEIHLDGPDGQVIATAEPAYTNGWQDYQTTTAEIKGTVSGTHDLYITFKYRLSDISFSAAEEKMISEADLVITVPGTRTIDGEGALGNEASDSAEERDRETIDFPRNQSGMVLKCAELNENTIACIQAVGQMNLEPFKEKVKAITWSTYNGQAQGNALGRILYGEKNPSAKLPFTWYTSLYELDDIGTYNMRADENSNGRTYQYFTGDITYPFGYGLSYTNFEYRNVKLNKTTATTKDQIQVTVDVKNAGKTDGQEVVQMYVVSPDAAAKDRPVKRLKGFEKVALKAGETKKVTLTLETEGLSYWIDNKFDYDLGTYEIQIGTSSADQDIKGRQTFTMTEKTAPKLKCVTLTGKAVFDEMEIGTAVDTELTAALSDDSFCDVTKDMVTYKSSNPDAAKVDENGKVTMLGMGTAVITAEVTKDGVTQSGSYAVAASEEESVTDLYYITNKGDQNLVVAVYRGLTQSGTQLIEWANNQGVDQQWLMKETEDGYYQFVNYKSSLLMSVKDTNKDSIIVQAEEAKGDKKQLWQLKKTSEEGYYKIVNAASGLALSRGPSTAAEPEVKPFIQKEESDSSDQIWSLESVMEQYVIMSSAGEGGTINPNGRKAVAKGSNKVYTITPDEGYKIKDVKVDGKSVGAVDKYIFQNVTADAAIEATFEKTSVDPPKPPKMEFVDVADTDWFYDYVLYVFEKGIMTGLDKYHFGPSDSLSRGQFVTILYRMEGEPEVEYTATFPDVADGIFYTKPALWANREKVVSGYENGSFGPSDNITREQMAVMMYRYADYKKYNTSAASDLDEFSDGDKVSAFAKKAMEWAVGAEVISGNADGTLAPQGNASRAVCATIIQRFLEKAAK